MRLPLPRLTVVLGVFAAGALAVSALMAEPLSVGELDQPETPAADTTPQIQEVVDAAEAFQRRDISRAKELLKQAAEKHPELPPPSVILAQWLARVNQGAAARQSLEQAVNEAPNDPYAYLVLGDIALRERRVTEAYLLYSQADSLLDSVSGEQKDKIEARVNAGLAAVAEARQHWPTAQKHLEVWLKLDPNNALAMRRLARALFKQGKASEAKDQLQAAHELDPENSQHWGTIMAQLYQEADSHDLAKQWMNYALKAKDTKHDELKTRLVATQWAIQTGQTQLAKEQATAALEANPESLRAKVLRGVVALFEDDYASAERYFDSALRQEPDNFAAKNNLALALVEQTNDQAKQQRAEAYAQENLRLHPKSAEAASTYGWVLYNLGELRGAAQALQQAAASGNMSPDTAYYLARVYTDMAKQASDNGNSQQADQLKGNARQLVNSALQADRPFSKRDEAEALAKQLG